MDNDCCDTLILSDLHLGSRASRASEAIVLLEKQDFKRLILLGDTFDDLNLHWLKPKHWEFLSVARKLYGRKEIVFIRGNHDEILFHLGNILGITVVKEYVWRYNGKKYIATHGNQFDKFLNSHKTIGELAYLGYFLLQKLNPKAASFLKRRLRGLLNIYKDVADGAIRHAEDNGADVIICGHTHLAELIDKKGIKYYNAGCLTDTPSSYVTIDEKGARIREIF